MILISGASGLVGTEFCKFLDSKNIKYIGTYNKNKIGGENMFQIDFYDSKKLETFLLEHNINFCIFCIVERLLDKCENNWNDIKKTNVELVHITSYICNKLNIKFIHLSTDYVFDGSVQPNYPDTLKNPLQNYGISKLISEYRVMTNCKKYCIIRTPVLYSSLSKIHENAVCLIGKNIMDLRDSKQFIEDNYCIRRPLYISDLCQFIYDCIDISYNGIYHFYNPYNKFTKYEICNIIGHYLNINPEKIKPNNTKCEGIAPRPYDTQLADDKIVVTSYSFTNFCETISECFKKFKHQKITFENKNDFFICLDMDGTIIDTNIAHYNAYKKVFETYNKDFLNIDEWNNIILNDNIDNYLKNTFDEQTINDVKFEKREFLKKESISYTKNSYFFLNFLIDNDFNFCIVTNTNEATVEIFKEKLPLLNKIKQWVYREDYNLPKPSSECYELAKKKYYKNEHYIVGFEDSLVGYKALKSITDIIYICDNEFIFKNNDCYLFDDYVNQIINNIIL
jgi:dTDP-4-dehydrorhamnose reductase